MLLVAVRLAGRKVSPTRLIFGALFGAGAAQAARSLALSQTEMMMLWLPTAGGMMALSVGRPAVRHPVRYALLLLCAAGLLGGVVLSFFGATGSLAAAYSLSSVCMPWLVIHALSVRRNAKAVRQVRVVCRYRGRTAAFDALVDSGNTLRDYLTKRPVIVLADKAGRKMLGLEGETLRPIFADTAGGRQMMALLTPQETIVMMGGRQKKVLAALALSDGLDEGALLPASLLEDDEEAFWGSKAEGDKETWNRRER